MVLTDAIFPNPALALLLLLLTTLPAFVLPPSTLCCPAEDAATLLLIEPARLADLLPARLATLLLLGSLKPDALSAAAMPASAHMTQLQGYLVNVHNEDISQHKTQPGCAALLKQVGEQVGTWATPCQQRTGPPCRCMLKCCMRPFSDAAPPDP